MNTMTFEGFREALQAQGVPREHFAFKCPMCATLQSATSLIRAGAGENFDAIEPYLGFSCVGRWQGGPGPTEAKAKGIACNWTLGGLFSTHTLEIETPDGKKHMRFDVATPAEAQELMAAQA